MKHIKKKIAFDTTLSKCMRRTHQPSVEHLPSIFPHSPPHNLAKYNCKYQIFIKYPVDHDIGNRNFKIYVLYDGWVRGIYNLTKLDMYI